MALAAFLVVSALGSTETKAVRLDPEAGGQVLIYPYYTVRSYGTDPFNTYLSIVNTSAVGKVLKVRFREGDQALQALAFNLFLSPNDTWTGAVVPSADGGAQLVTRDASCVSPAMAAGGDGARIVSLSSSAFPSGGAARTREGYVEVIEMGTLHGAALAAITQDGAGVPQDCAAVQGATYVPPPAELGPPGGGLRGTLTLINVASGMDFTVNADALADFSVASHYAQPSGLGPDLADADPVSLITTAGFAYRLQWSSGIDAVSSVLMRDAIVNEYILDTATASSSDWVLTFPTRFRLVGAASSQAPFAGSSAGAGCEMLLMSYFNREAAGTSSQGTFSELPASPPFACHATTVWSVIKYPGTSAPAVFGSANGTGGAGIPPPFQDGWAKLRFTGNGPAPGLVSLPGSSRLELRTGLVTTGAVRVQGLPVTGFLARTFINGLLACASGTCQGAYGSAFSHRSSRALSPVQ